MRKQISRTSPEWYNCECPVCGCLFHRKKSALDKAKTKPCCSVECLREYKRKLMSGSGNHQFGLKGSRNSSWKSDECINSCGYRLIRCLDHPFRDKADFVMEHRLVAEQYLLNDENSVSVNGKKYLSPDYVVHHIDFNPLNNDPSNLLVMTKAEHQCFHAKLNPANRNDKTGRFAEDDDILKARKITPTAILPRKATNGSACWDLYADTEDEVIIPPHKTVLLQTNIALQIPEGYCGLIFARSGISTKRYLRPSTCVSVIDSDYRGSVGLPIHNDSDFEQSISPKERIAQLMLAKPAYFDIELVDELDETERGDKGFGSSGR